MRTSLFSITSPLLVLLATGCGGSDADAPKNYSAEIRRTSYGIPHIQAKDEAGLGYGVGYAHAQDNFCFLAEQFITLRGERSRYFGPDTNPGVNSPGNENSDFFYKLYNDDATVRKAWSAQIPEVKALLSGFAVGFNRYIEDTGRANLPQACRGAEWIPKVDELDMIRVARYFGGMMGIQQFIPMIAAAQPPSASGSMRSSSQRQAGASARLEQLVAEHAERRAGSNAVALGRDATDNRKGLLLGNAHLSWSGPQRLQQLHVTIPGKIDAMGATLPGFPVVTFGFTRQFAWTHTASSSAHATIYRMQLDPLDPTRYLVDGQSKRMEKRSVSIKVRGADGQETTRTHDFYRTEFGIVLSDSEAFPWTATEAYAFRDVNDENYRGIEHWYEINRANSMQDMKAAMLRVMGSPWANTMAADAHGDTLFMGVMPTPNLTSAQVTQCSLPGFESLRYLGTWVLNGTAACRWNDDPAAPQPGIFASANLPVLSRTDYVQNSNDSAWLSNPTAPLTGYSPVISQEGVEQSVRTRMGITQLEDRLSGLDGLPGKSMSAERLQSLVLRNHAHLADLVMDDLLSLCPGGSHAGTGNAGDLAEACTGLAAWNRKADLDAGVGYGYFEQLASSLQTIPQAWRVPFDPANPARTPRGLKADDPAVRDALRSAMATAVATVRGRGWKPGMTWGQMQFATRGNRSIPIHGGSGFLGIYNVIMSDPAAGTKREVQFGTSYLQVVGFGAGGPEAKAVLSYSESSDPASPHFSDQTELFSRKQWVTLPFSEAQVSADAKPGALKISE